MRVYLISEASTGVALDTVLADSIGTAAQIYAGELAQSLGVSNKAHTSFMTKCAGWGSGKNRTKLLLPGSCFQAQYLPDPSVMVWANIGPEFKVE